MWKYVVPEDRRFHLRQGKRPSVWKPYPTPHGDLVAWLTNAVYRAYWHPPDRPALQTLDNASYDFIEDLPDTYDISSEIVAAASAGDFGAPLADSAFAVYLDEGGDEDNRRLIYIKQPCADADAQPKFFPRIFSAEASDLPADRQEHRFDNRDFWFEDWEVSHDWRVATRPLPDYAIERIRAGQFTRAARYGAST